MSAGEIVRILTVRKKHDLHIHAFLQYKADSTQSSLYSGSVTVIDDGDIGCELAYQTYLLYRQ